MIKKPLLILLVLNVILVACATVEKQQRTIYRSIIKADNTIAIQDRGPIPVLRVATLNLAHGRKDSLNQFFLWTSTIKENLDDIADVLSRHKPHVVALQEADAASFWSRLSCLKCPLSMANAGKQFRELVVLIRHSFIVSSTAY